MDIYGCRYEMDGNPAFKISIDRDVLPADCESFMVWSSTADHSIPKDLSERFWHFYDKVRWVSMLDCYVCLDFGKYFWESGMQSPDIKE